jgi:hypothetical protein
MNQLRYGERSTVRPLRIFLNVLLVLPLWNAVAMGQSQAFDPPVPIEAVGSFGPSSHTRSIDNAHPT